MERNMQLARRLLEAVAEHSGMKGVDMPNLLRPFSGGSVVLARPNEALYHLALLEGGGYLTTRQLSQHEPIFYEMTWDGHDLLESLRNDPRD